jgi:DNA ligase (NAD+)
LNQPEIEDFEYDELLRELLKLESEYPELVSPDSPTQRVGGAPTAAFAKVTHRHPMLSLEFAYDETRIRKFDEGLRERLRVPLVEYSAEVKFDGLAISLRYSNGRFISGATRGDGRIGDDVTENLRTISSIPRTLPSSPLISDLEVRGEVVMFKEDLQALREQQRACGERESPNPRNAAAGSVRQLDPKITASRKLHFFPYALFTENLSAFAKQSECLAYLASAKFLVAKEYDVVRGIDEVLRFYEGMKRIRESLPYQIDGVVFKVNDLASQRLLGSRPKEPYFAIARKFPPEKRETRVRGIDVQVGRTGALTPVARVDPVFVGGVTVKNITLHNEGEIRQKDIHIGDYVVVQRAGDVIPEIVEVIREKRASDVRPFEMPTHCRECGSRVVKAEGEAVARCSGGLFCPAQRKQALVHFASRKAMNIVGLGYETIAALMENIEVREPADLYRLGDLAWQWIRESRPQWRVVDVLRGSGRAGPLYQTLLVSLDKCGLSDHSSIDELANLTRTGKLEARGREVRIIGTLSLGACPKTSIKDGRSTPRIGERDAEKLEREIERSKSVPLERFIYALGIRHVGEEIARILANEYGTLEGFLSQNWDNVLAKKIEIQKENDRRKRKQEVLLTEPLRGVGEKILVAIKIFLSEQNNINAIERLQAAGVRPFAQAKSLSAKAGPFAGKRVLLTGTFDRMSRSDLEQLLRVQGAQVASSFSKELDYVIYGTRPGSKLEKAKAAQIPVIAQEAFFRMLDEAP